MIFSIEDSYTLIICVYIYIYIYIKVFEIYEIFVIGFYKINFRSEKIKFCDDFVWNSNKLSNNGYIKLYFFKYFKYDIALFNNKSIYIDIISYISWN